MRKPAKRPFGLNAIIVMQALTVLLTGALLALGGFAFYLAEIAQLPEDITLDGNVGPYTLFILAFTFAVNLLCAVGLWRRQRWAWYLTMLQVGFFMLEDLYSYFTAAPSEDYVWTMLINVIMVFYLNQRDVQAVFQRKGLNDPANNPARAHAPAAPGGTSL
jgi:hypothetical protein